MVNVEMTPTQQRWINDTTRELLIEGSAGSGKTIFACFKVIFYALNYPDASIYIYRRTLPSLKRTSWKEIRNILYDLDIPYDENKSEGVITFPNNSKLYFGALDELSKVRSINADMIYIISEFVSAIKNFLDANSNDEADPDADVTLDGVFKASVGIEGGTKIYSIIPGAAIKQIIKNDDATEKADKAA